MDIKQEDKKIMVLHIGIDGIDGVGKTTMTGKLQSFLEHKNYKVKVEQQPSQPDIIEMLDTYHLSNHEIALLMALDRSITYYNNNYDEYDIVLWDRTVLSSYAYNTDEYTPNTYIRQINKYFPEMDLYIIIKTDCYLQEQDYTTNNPKDLIRKYDWLIRNHRNTKAVDYQPDEPDKVFNQIVQTIFDNLPRCEWCGRLFKPTKHYKKYCKDQCREYSLQDQYRVNNRNYYYRYKDVMTEKQKGGLGSKGANLHARADLDPVAEMEKVRNAKKALGLKPITDQ